MRSIWGLSLDYNLCIGEYGVTNSARDSLDILLQTVFLHAYSCKKMLFSLKLHCDMFLGVHFATFINGLGNGLPELMVTHFSDAYMRQSPSKSWS